MNTICERSFSPNDASLQIDNLFDELGLKVLEDRHEQGFSASHIVVEGENGILSSGSGKGVHHKIGARAECIEHYFTQTALARPEGTASSHQVANQKLLANDGIIRSLLQFDEIEIPVVKMDPLDECIDASVLIPHTLINPDIFDVHETDDEAHLFLGKYSSNSGTAFGLTKYESQLHALMETIERHTQSNLFLSILGHKVEQDFVHTKLSSKLMGHLSCAPELTELPEINLIGCKTLGGAYFFCAVEASPKGTLAEYGAGCSQDALFALERAVSECAQCIGIVKGEELEEDKRAIELFAELPGLDILKTLSVEKMDNLANTFTHTESIAYLLDKGIQAKSIADPEEMLRSCIGHLTAEGYNVVGCDTKTGEFGYVSRVYVPGFDRFHLIRSGLKVAPNSVLA
ncbi:MAG: YcaO-like family protein [Paracoccaceae bacterium]